MRTEPGIASSGGGRSLDSLGESREQTNTLEILRDASQIVIDSEAHKPLLDVFERIIEEESNAIDRKNEKNKASVDVQARADEIKDQLLLAQSLATDIIIELLSSQSGLNAEQKRDFVKERFQGIKFHAAQLSRLKAAIIKSAKETEKASKVSKENKVQEVSKGPLDENVGNIDSLQNNDGNLPKFQDVDHAIREHQARDAAVEESVARLPLPPDKFALAGMRMEAEAEAENMKTDLERHIEEKKDELKNINASITDIQKRIDEAAKYFEQPFSKRIAEFVAGKKPNLEQAESDLEVLYEQKRVAEGILKKLQQSLEALESETSQEIKAFSVDTDKDLLGVSKDKPGLRLPSIVPEKPGELSDAEINSTALALESSMPPHEEKPQPDLLDIDALKKTFEGKSIEDLAVLLGDARREYAAADAEAGSLKNTFKSLWEKTSKFLGHATEDANKQELLNKVSLAKTRYSLTLEAYRNAQVNGLEGLSGAEKSERMVNVLESSLREKVLLYDHRIEAAAPQGFWKMTLDKIEWYKRLDWKKKALISAGVMGIGLTGGVVAGTAATGLMMAMRGLSSGVAASGTFSFLEGRSQNKREQQIVQERSDFEQILENSERSEEFMDIFRERLEKNDSALDKDLAEMLKTRKKETVASALVGSFIAIGGPGTLLHSASEWAFPNGIHFGSGNQLVRLPDTATASPVDNVASVRASESFSVTSGSGKGVIESIAEKFQSQGMGHNEALQAANKEVFRFAHTQGVSVDSWNHIQSADIQLSPDGKIESIQTTPLKHVASGVVHSKIEYGGHHHGHGAAVHHTASHSAGVRHTPAHSHVPSHDSRVSPSPDPYAPDRDIPLSSADVDAMERISSDNVEIMHEKTSAAARAIYGEIGGNKLSGIKEASKLLQNRTFADMVRSGSIPLDVQSRMALFNAAARKVVGDDFMDRMYATHAEPAGSVVKRIVTQAAENGKLEQLQRTFSASVRHLPSASDALPNPPIGGKTVPLEKIF